ncbi:MAG: DUF2236 domain-containing protein [Cyclobacteriaceae bacterium]|nr:DUF2236 domain-containing protein [Cyclobacteriaceae bacterium]
MSHEYFVARNSIVRQIWGKSDTILFIFAGASAEFALNKAVDWLYFTGRLPADPLGRLFSTVSYARTIVFSEKQRAHQTIDAMAAIHTSVEKARGHAIPDWAYRDVLFMLMDYSIRAYELLERTLTLAEKYEVFDVFARMGNRLGVTGLPETFAEFIIMRQAHLNQNLQRSSYTDDLYQQYKRHLGIFRYRILLEVQSRVVPERVSELLGLRKVSVLPTLLVFYKKSKLFHMDGVLRYLLLPSKYKNEIKALDN